MVPKENVSEKEPVECRWSQRLNVPGEAKAPLGRKEVNSTRQSLSMTGSQREGRGQGMELRKLLYPGLGHCMGFSLGLLS